ncbi:MAG: hypothetical protein H0T46_00715 [Deltaproteobacteria bacterium]|nr:hypothetical protein [Deltaproteobacteria bacterium]
MKLLSTLSLVLAFAGATPVLADTPPAKAPAEKKAPPAKTDASKTLSADEVKKAMAFFDEFHGAIVKNQDACPKMGPAVNAVLDKHEVWLRKMAETGKDLPPAEKEKLQKKQADMMSAVMKCKDDKGVMDAFQRLAVVMTPKTPAK